MALASAPELPPALANSFADLFAEPLAATLERTDATYDRLTQPFQNRLVICGAGQLGRYVLPGVRAAGIEPLAFCDNNPALWGASIDGVTVVSPGEAVKLHGAHAAFLTAIYNARSMQRQLQLLGCARIVPYVAFYWKHSRALPSEERLVLPQVLAGCLNELAPAFDLLADRKSRDEFRAQIRWRYLLDYGGLPEPEPLREMYFPPDVLCISEDEIFADCGAFDGDTIRSLIETSNGQFRRIYAFEPDAANSVALSGYLNSLPDDLCARIETLPYAVSRANGTVRFNAEGSMGSKMDDAGAVEVECRSLDSILRDRERPTFIKMDVEGAEPDALAGAAATMRLGRPIMAVCAYHRYDHLWQIPRLLKSANRDYRIFLRRYGEECWETVYYAVPPERVVASNGPEME